MELKFSSRPFPKGEYPSPPRVDEGEGVVSVEIQQPLRLADSAPPLRLRAGGIKTNIKNDMKKSVLVFDFDGVLTNGGEGLKQKAWDILALPLHPANADLLHDKRGAFSGGKGSRSDILRETFVRFYPNDENLLTVGYAECYNTIVQKLLEQSGMPEGTEQTLAQLDVNHTLFVNSATPENAVRESIQNFCLTNYFRGIYGQPTSKVENLERAWKLARVDKEFMLFVGDSDGDRAAAKEFGCAFIGVANDWNKWRTKHDRHRPFVLVDSIAELPKLLEI